jgi:type II secretory pathway predicted ATPase ExeA
MYEGFFHLSGKPFSLLPDADFIYPSKRHRRALALLDYCIDSQAGFAVITGEVGAGKTTIVRRFLRLAPRELTVGVVTNTSASMGSLLTWVCAAFGLPHVGLDNITLSDQFADFLLDRYGKGSRTLLVVDEAQNLSMEMLEALRMLSNVNVEKDILLQVVLVGQPELLETLRRTELRQFAQRIAVHYHLEALEADETRAYIHHRLSVVDGETSLFDDSVCSVVHYFTGGVPRLINLLCDLALVYAFAEGETQVSVGTIVEVVSNRSSGGLSPFRLSPVGLDADDILRHLDGLSAQHPPAPVVGETM